MGERPLALFSRVITSSFGSSFGMQDLALLLTPLVACGLAVAVAMGIGAWNIGAEGQFNIGALAATGVGLFVPGPTWALLPAMLVAGLAGGALWIALPAFARARLGVSELITTLLLNFVALLLVYYVATGPWLDPSGRALATTARVLHELPTLVGIVHWGLPIAVAAAIVIALLMRYTRWGYEVRIAGANPEAARYAGMPATRRFVTVMLLSGAIAGLGGMIEVAGTAHRLQGGISNGFGYLGITVAVLAFGSPLGVLATGLFIAVLLNAGVVLQTQGVNGNTVLALTGLVLFLTAMGDEAAHWRLVREGAALDGARLDPALPGHGSEAA